MIWLVPLLLALSCKTPEAVVEEKVGETGTTDTGEGPFLAVDESEATWSIDDVSAAANEALGYLWEIDPLIIFTRYQEMISKGDGDCPSWSSDGVWSGYCTTSSGLQIDGSADLDWSTDFADKDHQYDHSIRLKADARFTTVDDSTLMIRTTESRYSEYTTTSKGGKHHVAALVEGDFGWSNSSVDDTWLRHAARVEMEIKTDAGTSPATHLSGTVSGLPGTWIDAMSLDYFYFDAVSPEDDCAEEPAGGLSLHSIDMEWYEIRFHGTGSQLQYDGDSCDGCGDAYHGGILVGTVCPDWSLWTSWKDRPW